MNLECNLISNEAYNKRGEGGARVITPKIVYYLPEMESTVVICYESINLEILKNRMITYLNISSCVFFLRIFPYNLFMKIIHNNITLITMALYNGKIISKQSRDQSIKTYLYFENTHIILSNR